MNSSNPLNLSRGPVAQYRILDERLRDRAHVTPATPGSAGFDLYACIDEPLLLQPGETKLISSGLMLYLEDPSYVGTILPRSGLGHKHGLVLGNLVGVIDADYQGPLMISAWNRSAVPYTIQPLERIAQYVVLPVVHPTWTEVQEFVVSERGEGGFGSSGKH